MRIICLFREPYIFALCHRLWKMFSSMFLSPGSLSGLPSALVSLSTPRRVEMRHRKHRVRDRQVELLQRWGKHSLQIVAKGTTVSSVLDRIYTISEVSTAGSFSWGSIFLSRWLTALFELALTGRGNSISFFLYQKDKDSSLVRFRAPGVSWDKHLLQIFQAAQDVMSPPKAGDRAQAPFFLIGN